MKSREDVVAGLETFPEALLQAVPRRELRQARAAGRGGLSRAARAPRAAARLRRPARPPPAARCERMSATRTTISPADPPADLLRALIEQSLELLVVTDATGRMLWANERFAAATGWPADGTRRSSTRAARRRARRGDARRLEGALLGRHARRGAIATARRRRRRALGRRARRAGSRPHALDLHRRQARRASWRRRHGARASCSTPPRSSAASASGSGGSRPAKADGTGTSSASGASIRPTARRPSIDAIQRIHPEDRERMNYLESTQRAGRYAQRYRVIHPDGRTRWIHSQWEVKNGPHGQPDRAVGIMMDDTEAYDSARALGDVSAQLKMAVELGNIAIWRHDLRSDRMYYSDRAFQLLQMEPRPEGMAIDEIRAMIHPDDLPGRARIGRAGAALRPADRHGSALPPPGRQLALRDDAARRRARRARPAPRLRRRRPRRHRSGRAPAPRRRAGAPARGRVAARPASACGRPPTTRARPTGTHRPSPSSIASRRRAPPTSREWLRAGVHPDDQPRVGTQAHAYLTAGDGPFELEFRTLRRDGSVRWIVMRADRDRAAPTPALPRRRHRRHRAPRRARRVARRQRARIADRPLCRHRHVGGAPRRLARALGRRRCSICAACRRASDAPTPRRAAWRWSTPTTSRRCSTRSPNAPAAPCRPRTNSAGRCPTAAGAGSPRARPRSSTTRPAGAPRRRQLGHHREQGSRAGASADRARRARDPRQVAVPLAHEPRAAHAAQRRARLHPAAADRGAPVGAAPSRRQARPHPRRRRPPALADQRRARSLRPRVGRAEAVAAARSNSARWCASRCR